MHNDLSVAAEHAAEVTAGRRFEFGKNWQRFLATLSERRIAEAERSLSDMLGVDDLADTTFLDAGSGSGLFSLAARRQALGSLRLTTTLSRSPAPTSSSGDPFRTMRSGRSARAPRWTARTSSRWASSTWSIPGACCITRATCGRLSITSCCPWPTAADCSSRSTTPSRYWTPLHTWLKRTYVSLPRVLAWPHGRRAGLLSGGQRSGAPRMRNPLAAIAAIPGCAACRGGTTAWTWDRRLSVRDGHARGRVRLLPGAWLRAGADDHLRRWPGCNQFVFRKVLDRWRWTKHPFRLEVSDPGTGPPS